MSALRRILATLGHLPVRTRSITPVGSCVHPFGPVHYALCVLVQSVLHLCICVQIALSQALCVPFHANAIQAVEAIEAIVAKSVAIHTIPAIDGHSENSGHSSHCRPFRSFHNIHGIASNTNWFPNISVLAWAGATPCWQILSPDCTCCPAIQPLATVQLCGLHLQLQLRSREDPFLGGQYMHASTCTGY